MMLAATWSARTSIFLGEAVSLDRRAWKAAPTRQTPTCLDQTGADRAAAHRTQTSGRRAERSDWMGTAGRSDQQRECTQVERSVEWGPRPRRRDRRLVGRQNGGGWDGRQGDRCAGRADIRQDRLKRPGINDGATGVHVASGLLRLRTAGHGSVRRGRFGLGPAAGHGAALPAGAGRRHPRQGEQNGEQEVNGFRPAGIHSWQL